MKHDKIIIKDKSKELIIGAIISIFIVSILSIFLCNKTIPTAEGWYSYYAKCILNGETVYKDFEYLFTPLYMYIIAFFVKYVGYNLLALRILGVIFYAILALIIYLILSNVFSVNATVIGTVTGMLYLQSEVYTVFYDYVRVMDIFAYISVLFMILCLKKWQTISKRNIYLYLWGIFSALFFLIKQNMGGLFFVYSLMLLVFCYICFSWRIKKLFMVIFKYCFAFAVPTVVLMLLAIKLDIANDMINSIFFGAIEAKGGIFSILFRWIIVFYHSFAKELLWGILFVLILILNKRLSNVYPKKNETARLMILYIVAAALGLGFICSSKKIGNYFSLQNRLDVTTVFIATVILLFTLLITTIWKAMKKKEISNILVLITSLLGTYFTISYGAGMSGGLSIGESALGLAVLICILYDSFRFQYSSVFKVLIIIYCLHLSFSCVGYKLINPCQWWGINESIVYDSNQTTDIEVLDGIKVSESTKELYENVTHIVDKNTNKNDSIYCFPHIPLFYVLCDRTDPGVYSKVQWFDVSTNASVTDDIDILYNEKPSAILIYNLYDSTYEGHENAFNGGEESGTRKMRNELYTLVNTYNYSYEGTFISDNNNISVYILRDDDIKDCCIFEKGNGTQTNPYIIDSKEKLVNLAMLINQGNDFENIYFRQEGDFDMSDIIWVPAGYIENASFKGIYLSNGYTIQNINSSSINSNLPFGTEIFK